MSYYSRRDDSWWPIIISLILVFALMFSFNTCTASEWNGGVCPDCEVRYELRGVSKYMKYYSCPKCGNEVERY